MAQRADSSRGEQQTGQAAPLWPAAHSNVAAATMVSSVAVARSSAGGSGVIAVTAGVRNNYPYPAAPVPMSQGPWAQSAQQPRYVGPPAPAPASGWPSAHQASPSGSQQQRGRGGGAYASGQRGGYGGGGSTPPGAGSWTTVGGGNFSARGGFAGRGGHYSPANRIPNYNAYNNNSGDGGGGRGGYGQRQQARQPQWLQQQQHQQRYASNGPAGASAAAPQQPPKPPSPPPPPNPRQRMVVLVACPGAGKSFFSERLIRATVAHNAAAAAVQAAAAALDATLEATPPAAATVADQSASAAVSSDSPSTIEQPASKRPRTDDVPAFNVAAALDFVPAQSPPATNSTAPASGASAAPPSTSSSSASAHAAAASVSPTSPAAAAAAPAPPSATFLANARLALAPFVRINQDTLGSRRACELAADKALRDGFSVIIDRTNIDAAQRATWRKLAAKHSLVNVDAVILQVPVEVCKQRVMGRVGHETLPPTSASLDIVDRFMSELVLPVAAEGFGHVFVLQHSEDEEVYARNLDELIQKCMGVKGAETDAPTDVTHNAAPQQTTPA